MTIRVRVDRTVGKVEPLPNFHPLPACYSFIPQVKVNVGLGL